MKRTALIATVLLALFATMAYAGIWGDIKDAALTQVAYAIVTGIFFILTIVFGTKFAKWKKVAQEGVDVAVAVYKATLPNSPGGKKMVQREIENILKESGEFGTAVFNALGKKA